MPLFREEERKEKENASLERGKTKGKKKTYLYVDRKNRGREGGQVTTPL